MARTQGQGNVIKWVPDFGGTLNAKPSSLNFTQSPLFCPGVKGERPGSSGR